MSNIETIKLDNGLTVYLFLDSRRHSTFFQFTTLCGGIDKDVEVDSKTYHFNDGLAHILEHYVVEENSVGNFIKLLGEKQMNTNASTGLNSTSYYFETVENVLYGINTVLTGVNSVTFDKDRLEKLKNPICQEIRAKSDSRFYHLNRMSLDNIFNDIKFRDIGGRLDEITNTTIDDVKDFYDCYYRPNNQFIVVAGNFDKDEVINEIKNFYKDSKKCNDINKIIPKEDLSIKKKEDTLYYRTPLEYVSFSFKFDFSKYSTKDRLKLDFYLHRFYNNFFGMTSPLYDELVKNNVISASIGCGDTQFNDTCVINIGAYTHNVDYFKKSIIDTINKMDSFDKEKFDLDKKVSLVALILRDENIFDTIMPFIDNIIYFNYPYVDTVDDFDEFEYDDYVNMIKDLDFSNYTVTTIIDDSKK